MIPLRSSSLPLLSLRSWRLSLFAAFGFMIAPLAVHAALPVGAQAPMFTAQATLGGEDFSFSLAEALKKGPVVLYFYPAAFTPGCTVEAHLFAEATEQFAELGATVIGMSADDLETLRKFSVSECRSKFAVAADPDIAIAKQYDAVLINRLLGKSSRTSYVIAPDGTILAALDEGKPEPHIEHAMKAVKDWRLSHPE